MTSKSYKDDVAVYKMNAETGEHTFVFDFAALDRVEREAFERGKVAGAADAKPARGEEALKQIDRMGRQIEECHSIIRRRNEEIKALEADMRLLSSQACCKGCC